MLETIADTDEEFMTAYLNDSTEITPSLIRKALRRGCLDRKLVPVLCGASLKGKGIEPLLDSIVEYSLPPTTRWQTRL